MDGKLTVAGIIKDAEAMVIKEHMVDATVGSNFCSIPPVNPALELRIPPKKKQHPRTKRMFDKTLPSMLD